jgi:hypothetical protein
MNRNALVSPLVVLIAAMSAWGQVKVSTITDETTESSKVVMIALRAKLASHPKAFTLVENNDSDTGLLITADCMPRKAKEDFTCFYTSHYAGLAAKTFMGGGIYASSTAEDVADNLLGSIAQDVAERWNSTSRRNNIESLEACLFLTQSTCKVPGQLESELKTKIINLSQYLQKGGLKK